MLLIHWREAKKAAKYLTVLSIGPHTKNYSVPNVNSAECREVFLALKNIVGTGSRGGRMAVLAKDADNDGGVGIG